MNTSRCILLHHAHIGDEHIIPSFIGSICLVLRNAEHVTLPTRRSYPHSRSTHLSLRRFVSLSTTRFMSTPCCILLDHAHNGDQLIPSFVNSFRLVLHNHEHVTLHTPRSCQHWRSTHPYLSQFDYLSLQDYEQIMFHTPLSFPYWKSTHHTFLCWFNTLSTTRRWACHVANSSIMPTFKINTSFPSSIHFAKWYKVYEHATLHTAPSCRHWRSKHHSFIDLIRLVLLDYEHVTLHTPRSCPHWTSTHPFLRRFDSHTTRRLWARCIPLDHAHIGDQPNVPSFVDLICLVLQDHEHVTLHIFQSCPH
jgi:hypothetical protein